MMHTPAVEPAKPLLCMDSVSLRLPAGGSSEPVSWQILEGQCWAVVGPNGSGKTTLIEGLCGRVPLAGGEIVYHFSPNGASEECAAGRAYPEDQIAYVDFQAHQAQMSISSPFHQARWNSVSAGTAPPVSELLSARRVKGLNPFLVDEVLEESVDFQDRRRQIIGLLGIEGLLDKSIIQVSNGERRKVLLAQALLRDPQLLVLDNPFTGLDRSGRTKLAEIIADLMRRALPVIVATARWVDIPSGITHVLLMEDHRVIARGAKEEMAHSILSCGLRSPPAADLAEGQRRELGPARARVLVELDGASVAYGSVKVLRRIDWTVRAGERWALLGPNGAGKTTLLSLIVGDNPQAYANRISVFGRRRGSGESIWEVKAHIGWVAPELHLYHPRGISCIDVVCSGLFDTVGLYRHPTPKQRDRAWRWMEHLGTSQLAGVPFDRISEGEQRLVLIARALIKEPSLLILDEPCQGLDARHRDRVLQAVETLGGSQDTSIIYVTHDRRALPRTITHLLKLEQGRVVAKGWMDKNMLSLAWGEHSVSGGNDHGRH